MREYEHMRRDLPHLCPEDQEDQEDQQMRRGPQIAALEPKAVFSTPHEENRLVSTYRSQAPSALWLVPRSTT